MKQVGEEEFVVMRGSYQYIGADGNFFCSVKKPALFDLNSWIILILSAWVWIQDYLSLWSCEDPTNATEVGRPFSRIKYKIHVVLFIFSSSDLQLIGRQMKTVYLNLFFKIFLLCSWFDLLIEFPDFLTMLFNFFSTSELHS